MTWLDHTGAAILAGCVLLILFSLHRQRQDLLIEQNLMYASKSESLAFADWLQRDLSNVGWGLDAGMQRLEVPVVAADGRLRSFVFWRRPEAGAAPARMVYELQEAGSITVGGETIPQYQLVRCTSAATCASGTITGRSPARLTDFTLQLLGEDGMPATAETARYIRLRFSSSLPLTQERGQGFLRRTHWGTTLLLPDR